MKIFENRESRLLRSPGYNYNFNKLNGFFMRWGETAKDDPQFSPFGPEIADIEITTICTMGCSYCYKSNTSVGDNMSVDTFKKIITNINKNKQLTQVAFGLGATAEENPDLWEMCSYLKSVGIIPNGTVADITNETADKISSLFGACAVSIHKDKNICYDSVKKLTNRGMKQVNIHHVVYDSNFEETLEIFDDIRSDSRLRKLNAIVLLSLKKKGRAINGFNILPQNKFNLLVEKAFELSIPLGFDSCSAHKFLKAISNNPNKENLEMMVEPCESASFSLYANVYGKYYPCSFAEIGDGIDLVNCDNFNEVWNNNTFRHNLLNNNRECPLFDI